jgi:chemotaxis protein histidine kinase CheA
VSPFKETSAGEVVENDDRKCCSLLVTSKKFEAVKVASSLGLQGPSAPIGAQLLATGGTDDATTATTVYHTNLVTGNNSTSTAIQQPILNSLNSASALANMQASAEANSLDLQAMQSMDWLFKKERIYLLAQFWQQRATLAEKELSALKEKQTASTDGNSKTEGQQQSSQNAQSTETSHEHSNQTNTSNSNLEQELQAKDKEINQLVEEVSRLQQSLQRLQETSTQAAARLEEELETRRQQISRLESKLERQRDYDDLKREISVLRSVDLSQIPTSEPGKSLEHLLMERTKALQQAENLKPPTTPDVLGKLNILDIPHHINIIIA